jgi:hypothetical protein
MKWVNLIKIYYKHVCNYMLIKINKNKNIKWAEKRFLFQVLWKKCHWNFDSDYTGSEIILGSMDTLPILILPIHEHGLGCNLVVQHLPSMREALGSIPAPKNKRQKKTKKPLPNPWTHYIALFICVYFHFFHKRFTIFNMQNLSPPLLGLCLLYIFYIIVKLFS